MIVRYKIERKGIKLDIFLWRMFFFCIKMYLESILYSHVVLYLAKKKPNVYLNHLIERSEWNCQHNLTISGGNTPQYINKIRHNTSSQYLPHAEVHCHCLSVFQTTLLPPVWVVCCMTNSQVSNPPATTNWGIICQNRFPETAFQF